MSYSGSFIGDYARSESTSQDNCINQAIATQNHAPSNLLPYHRQYGSFVEPGCNFRIADHTGFTLYSRAMDDITFDQFANFIREFWLVPARKQIAPETQFERDLGLTGDDGDELLLATQRRFGVKLGSEETGIRETFNLLPNEYLFHSEGFEIFPFRFTSLFGIERYGSQIHRR